MKSIILWLMEKMVMFVNIGFGDFLQGFLIQ